MPRPSKVSRMPEQLRAELDSRIIANGFGDYVALAAWLLERGLEIGLSSDQIPKKSALADHGSELEQELESIRATTQAMKLVREAAPDDAELRSEANIALVQTETFNTLRACLRAGAENDPAERLKMLTRAARTNVDTVRAGIALRKYQEEYRNKIDAKLKGLESETGKKGALDMATLKRVREEVYGIFS